MKVSINLPHLSYYDFNRLEKLMQSRPVQFRKNMTTFLITEMAKYIKEHRVFRLSIMGEVRSGKTEVGTTLSLVYTKIFNNYLTQGCFNDLDTVKNNYLTLSPLTFWTDNIMGSQSEYIYSLREMERSKGMQFGRIWQIDETRTATGGLGSFSEELELKNLSNIIAKFMQSEIWICPMQFQYKNVTFGLYVFKKDVVNRENWCLFYKIEINARGIADYIFLGWVNIPLHTNQQLRKAYNEKKNQWIQQEIAGTVDKRAIERKKISQILADDLTFSILSPSGKSFKWSKEQQLAILEQYIIDGKTQRWNELEMVRIVNEARFIVLNKYTKELQIPSKQEVNQNKEKIINEDKEEVINEKFIIVKPYKGKEEQKEDGT